MSAGQGTRANMPMKWAEQAAPKRETHHMHREGTYLPGRAGCWSSAGQQRMCSEPSTWQQASTNYPSHLETEASNMLTRQVGQATGG